MLKQPESAATESLRLTIMNDTSLLAKFENSVFVNQWLTDAIMARFKHFIVKYVPLDDWAKGTQPDYLALAQEVCRYIHGTVCLDPSVCAVPLEMQTDGSVPTPKTTEKSLMNGYHVEKLTYVDGVCLDHMSDDEIVGRIAAIEKDMESLGKIKTSSKAIKRQLKKMGDTTKLMASFLDDRYEDDED